ncbi:MAG TPA: aquaporin [Deinococcales bacterium]|nr:aquaporin [Deinococcales bacterium]
MPATSSLPEASPETHPDLPPPAPWVWLAELAGTFFLTLIDAGGGLLARVPGSEVTTAMRSVAPGLVVAAMIYATSDLSGAHINPAVTLGFALRGVFPWARVPAHWLAQFAGAILAALALRFTFGNVAFLGANHAPRGLGVSFAVELVLTTLLLFVILNVSNRKGSVGVQSAVAVGCTIAASNLVFKGIADPSMNPARTLGPALVAGGVPGVWIYPLAQGLGMLLAVGIVTVLRGARKPEEVPAASGERQAHTQSNPP